LGAKSKKVENYRDLRPRERVWLEKYLECWNAAEAAREAGYKWPDRTGWRKKQELEPLIQAEIERRAMAADEVMTRLAERARFDVSPYLVTAEDGQIAVDLDRLIADGYGRHIKGVTHTRYGDRVLFYDGQEVLILMTKLMGLDKSAADDRPIRIIVERDRDYGRA
jgi:hypothetical protein